MDQTREIYLNDISNDYDVICNKNRLKFVIVFSRFIKRIKSVLRFTKKYFYKNSTHLIALISSSIIFLFILNEANIAHNNYKDSISEKLIEKIALNSSFTRNYNNETKNVGAPIWAQKESIKTVLSEAKNLDLFHKAALLATVEVESGFNPLAKSNLSTACGLFQFIKATGKAYGLSQTNCTEPMSNSRAGVSHYLDLYNTKIKTQVSDLEGIERAFRIFELTYYLHHDGINSSKPSSEVKAVVLKGTHFLIKSYMILKQEELNRENKNLVNIVLKRLKNKTSINYANFLEKLPIKKLTLAKLRF